MKAVDQAGDMLSKHREKLSAIKNDFSQLLELIKAWAKREYKEVPWKTIVLALAATLYLINPMDLIPDMIVPVGLTDDVAVISLILASLKKDIDQFLLWRNQS